MCLCVHAHICVRPHVHVLVLVAETYVSPRHPGCQCHRKGRDLKHKEKQDSCGFWLDL